MRLHRLAVCAVLLTATEAFAQAPDPSPVADELPAATEPAPPDDPNAAAVTTPTEEPVAAPADDGGELELSAAELAELGLGSAGAEAAPVDTSLKLYGFMDFNVQGVVNKRSSPWRGALYRRPAFYMGSFNVYLSKNLTETIRTFGEVRFSYFPAGTIIDQQTGAYAKNEAADHADVGRVMHWGAIEIERVYLEWAMHRDLTLRVGQFLTPYGIWNVDHGSPTIITFARPYVIGAGLFPERQTGFELFGRKQVAGSHAIGYHLTLSNGAGPIAEFKDLDGNKAVGGRAYWETDAIGELRIGGSFYYGRDTSSREVPGLQGSKVTYTEAIDQQYDRLSFAVDLLWRYRNLHFQAELIHSQVRYTDKGRVGATNPFTGLFIAPVDDTPMGVYGLLGYRFEWLGVMPYFMANYMYSVDPKSNQTTENMNLSAGLNIRPLEMVVLKVEYAYASFPSGTLVSDDPIHFMSSQVAWAF